MDDIRFLLDNADEIERLSIAIYDAENEPYYLYMADMEPFRRRAIDIIKYRSL